MTPAIRQERSTRLVAQIAPMGRRTRISPDSVWPLRGADGRTYAERKAQ